MMKKKLLLAIAAFLGINVATVAQNISCSDFSIEAIYQDTINPNTWQVSIKFNASASDFINYPYLSSITDCNGDTVATGSIFFFGQAGQTTQEYPVAASGPLTCQPLTAVFIYGDNTLTNDTCLLTFGTTGISQQADRKVMLSVFPNPFQHSFTIQTSDDIKDEPYFIHDQTGKLVLSGYINSETTGIDMSNYAGGIYLLSVGSDMNQSGILIKE